MDYEKVYAAFVADRRGRSPELCEEHHVLPRCLGGSDGPENLIRLSLSDHLFAHVLLARIHGGACAVAFAHMLNFSRYAGRRSRRLYAELKLEARRHLSAVARGRKHTPEARARMSAAQLERCANPQAAAERAAALYAPDAVRKAREGGRRYWDDPARREAMRGNTRSTGRVLSETHKARIGAATRRRWAEARAAEEQD